MTISKWILWESVVLRSLFIFWIKVEKLIKMFWQESVIFNLFKNFLLFIYFYSTVQFSKTKIFFNHIINKRIFIICVFIHVISMNFFVDISFVLNTNIPFVSKTLRIETIWDIVFLDLTLKFMGIFSKIKDNQEKEIMDIWYSDYIIFIKLIFFMAIYIIVKIISSRILISN